ncbi:hypothetical protein DFS34DRAFT_673834 [Phlyctochytrium arcticum]|nr:hypothetical protein DFS34DRAFT_673834 [Phlyctochytrium arcticum]
MTLFDQFKRFHNLYFLAGALSVLFQSSSLSPASQILPLVIVLAFSLAKEAYEDRTRYEADRDANNGLVQIMRNGQRVETIRMYVQTGDIMFLEKNQKSPVDAIILSSSYSDGTVFVETSELDGETNLKHKSAVNAFKHMQTDEDVRKLRGQISCELPNEKLNVFEGRIAISSPEPMPPVTVSLANLFLRGAVLRNTDFCWAVVVYTGTNTKIVKNLKRPKMKQSSLTGQLNKLVLVALAYNMFLLFTSVVLEYVQYKKILDKERARKLTHPNDYAIHWYVGPVDDNPGRHVFYTIVSFFCMYTYVIPISLFVTIEMVRLLQAKFMIWDSKMRISRLDAEGKVIKLKARANNSNLNEELSVVEYIFSDKTGTLTMNEMTAAAWYVGDQVVPEMTDPGLMGRKLDDPNSDDYEQECMMRFGHALTLCHDVVPSEDPKTGKMIYEAQSPDESALLHGIANSHFTLLGRSKDTITIDSRGQLMTFEQLGTLEFNSDRKRMSVIVKTENEGIIMYCKGADNVVFGRLDPDSEWNQHGVLDRAEIALTQFAEAGLRTLVVAWKPLTRMEYEEFRLLYDEAETSLVEREQKVADVAEIIERNMRFLGCTAIEDRLQPQVPETIEYLLAAGMKIWLLTGDKMETAVNIGMSSKLISPDMDMIILNRDTDEAITAQIQESLDSILTRVPPRRSALVIGGQILTRIFAPNSPHQQPLLRLASHCVTVICCRVTPMQKALVVRLVQKTLKCVTLAIGDGANDVSMIQSATVGVGVFGREGAQAVRAADYAIPEFRFLARLCGVHGRWARNRLSGLVFFSFYKNLVCITVQWLFGFLCLWSGQLVYEEIFFTGYNILFTSIPPFCYAIFNYDVPDRILRRNPELYRQVRKGLFWSRRLIFTTSASALMHSIIIFGFVWLTFFDNILDPNGHATSYYVQCFIFSTPMLCVVLMRSAVHSQIWLGRWMYITGGVLLASLAFDLLVKVVVEWLGFMQANTVDMLHVTPGFWIIGALIVCACFTIDWTVK